MHRYLHHLKIDNNIIQLELELNQGMKVIKSQRNYILYMSDDNVRENP